MIETRITNATTGGAKGSKPQQLHHIPPHTLLGVGEVFAYGADKYTTAETSGAYNYTRGIRFSLFFDAAMRHLWAAWGGEWRDPESGLPHIHHAIADLMMLDANDRKSCVRPDLDLDDRPPALDPDLSIPDRYKEAS